MTEAAGGAVAVLPEMRPVRSSNVEAVGHHVESGGMHVRFKGGDTYVYDGVSAEMFERALAAPSVGSFVHRHLKAHSCTKLAVPKATRVHEFDCP
jgi:hypothetical protein